MGLAGPSKKRKISHDPNNTNWTRSTGFGHRMLTSQGWSPGTILGPDPDNPHHTAASQVGIKVMLKDDTLGLGCRGNQEDTCTGLGDLQSLLGRLNGKTDESVRSEEDTRRKMWIEGRYGMRFVKGEVLESTWVTKGLKKGVEDVKEDSDVEVDSSEQETQSTDVEKDESGGPKGKKDKTKKVKSRKDGDKKKKKRKSSDSEDGSEAESSSTSGEDRKSDKAKRKADKAVRKAEKLAKKERKDAKRLRKDEKRRVKAEKKALKSAIAASTTPSSIASTPPALPSAELDPIPRSGKQAKSLPSSLHTSGTSTPVNGRQALRSKWIAQKRMAVMDAKALNEILMIKAA